MIIDYCDIEVGLEAIEEKKSKISLDLLPSTTVIDEDKSVKWNITEVNKINEQRTLEYTQAREAINNERRSFMNSVYEFIQLQLDFKVTEVQAQLIWEKVSMEADCDYYQIKYYLKSMINFLKELL